MKKRQYKKYLRKLIEACYYKKYKRFGSLSKKEFEYYWKHFGE